MTSAEVKEQLAICEQQISESYKNLLVAAEDLGIENVEKSREIATKNRKIMAITGLTGALVCAIAFLITSNNINSDNLFDASGMFTVGILLLIGTGFFYLVTQSAVELYVQNAERRQNELRQVLNKYKKI